MLLILIKKAIIIFFRYLLKFGEYSKYLGYNAMEDFFPKMSLKPNKDCDDYHCRKQQKKFAEEEVERLKNQPEIVETPDATNEIVHEENDWGISLVADDDDDVPGMDFINCGFFGKFLALFYTFTTKKDHESVIFGHCARPSR